MDPADLKGFSRPDRLSPTLITCRPGRHTEASAAVNPANVHELAEIASEIGADAGSGGWLVGNLDLTMG